MVKRFNVFAALAVLAVVASRAASAQNHITVDGRFSTGPVPYSNGVYTIGADLGKQVGNNLFHSFSQFSLSNTPVPESATFTSTGSTGPISNVISRVTGGNLSSINGAINSTITGANLYLINPSGIVFGPNATVNVLGSFHASTADYLKMSDGAKFQATNPDSSTLSAAPPAAFGFLTASPAQISVNGSSLGPVPGTLGLVGGPVTITGASLSAPAGTIHVTSAAGIGEVPVDPRNTPALTVTSFGPVAVTGGAKLDVSDPINLGSGGSVFIRSGALTISASEINADNYGSGSGGTLSLLGDSQVALSSGTYVHAVAYGSGTGAGVIISTTPTGVISADSSSVVVASVGSGDAGSLSVSGGQLSLTTGAIFASLTEGSGRGGDISIGVTGSLAVDGSAGPALTVGYPATGIASSSLSNATGQTGNITISAGSLSIVNNGGIASSTFGTAGSGNVLVNVSGQLAIDQTNATGIMPAVIFGIESQANPGSAGTAGNLLVNAGALSITNNGQLGTPTFGAGNAGNTTVNVSQALIMSGLLKFEAPGEAPAGLGTLINASTEAASDGQAGRIVVTAGGAIALSEGANVISSTAGAGHGGIILVTAEGPLTITDPLTGIAALTTSSSRGNAGSISVNASQITLSANAAISSLTAGTGTAGAVSVMTPGALMLNGGATIGASGFGVQSGPGGSVTVTANTLTIGGGGAHIASGTIGPGNGGNVNVIVTSDIVLTDPGPQITARSIGSGSAGSITISAGRLLLANGAMISTAAEFSKASGGNITLKVGDFLYLTNSGEITTSVVSTGNGGNITINPQSVVLNQSNIIAQAVQGHGGNITINANQFFQSADSIVSATSALGISGTIEIIGPRVDLNGALLVLSSELRSAAQVLRNSCAAQAGLPQSSLVEGGRGGLPQNPDATLPALYIAGRDMSPTSPMLPGPPPIPTQQTTARLTMHCG